MRNLTKELLEHSNYGYLTMFANEFHQSLPDVLKNKMPKIVFQKMDGDCAALYSHFKKTIYLDPECSLDDFVHELFHHINYISDPLMFYVRKLFKVRRKYKMKLHDNIYNAILDGSRAGRFDVAGEGYIAGWLLKSNKAMIEIFRIM